MGSCAATNQDGTPCSNDAMQGSNYCHVHQPEGTLGGGDAEELEHGFLTLMAGAMAVIFALYVLYQLLQ